ncbi:MAG TPA: hypothetical protein VM370_06050 [Candidatus Thermoplasmatota archaeon]|nr:hypothetical protein [Candidatus Thermoplasmatota archaeon]
MRALLLALLTLAPTAAACSMAGPVPGPGAFILVPDDGGANVTIPVEGRMSGAGCELSNAHLLQDGTFAWLEYDWNPNARTVHLRNMSTGETRVVPLKSAEATEFGLWNGHLVYLANDFTDGIPPTSHVYWHDIATDAAVELPFPSGNYPAISHDGRYVAASLRTNGFEGPDLIYLYDLEEMRFLVDGRPARELVGEDFVWPGAMGSGWLVLGGVRTPRLYELATGTVTSGANPDVYRAGAIVGGRAWLWEDEGGAMTLRSIVLPNGTVERHGTVDGRIIGKVLGYTVLGEYSAPQLEPSGRFAWLPGAAPWIVGVVFVVGAPTWWLVSRRLRSRVGER